MEEQELTDLISRYLDDALPEEETARVRAAVRSDPAAADRLRDLALQHVQLHRLFRQNEEAAPQAEVEIIAAQSAARSWRFLALAAGLAVLLAGGFLLSGIIRERSAAPATISLLKIGQEIHAAEEAEATSGLTATVPAGATQLLRFKDGTVFEFEQLSVIEIIDTGSETASKKIRLASGSLLADVTRQPINFPLCVITPHTEVVVAGTRFTCRAEKDHTHIRMHAGWAHVIQKINGAKAKLMAGHHVTAGERFHFRIRKMHETDH